MPAGWSGFTAERRFRGSVYRISVRKQPGTSGRVRSLRVDGGHVDGNLVPIAPPGSTVDVVAEIEPADHTP